MCFVIFINLCQRSIDEAAPNCFTRTTRELLLFSRELAYWNFLHLSKRDWWNSMRNFTQIGMQLSDLCFNHHKKFQYGTAYLILVLQPNNTKYWVTKEVDKVDRAVVHQTNTQIPNVSTCIWYVFLEKKKIHKTTNGVGDP